MTTTNGKTDSGNWLTHPITALVLRTVLGCVFIYASLDKIRHPDLFAEAVYNYQLLPEVAVNLVAICLPWLELLSGSLLVLGLWVQGSILILSGLMVASSMIITTGVKPLLFGFPALGIIGYLVSGILGLWLIYNILRSRKF